MCKKKKKKKKIKTKKALKNECTALMRLDD